jgi:hypothetical protein
MNLEMKSQMDIKSDKRSLFIDLELHVGSDPDSKKELIDLMIYDINELLQSLNSAVSQNNLDTYRKTSHKIVGTISLLNDKEFTDAIEALKTQDTDQNILLLKRIGHDIIKSLTAEIEILNGS